MEDKGEGEGRSREGGRGGSYRQDAEDAPGHLKDTLDPIGVTMLR